MAFYEINTFTYVGGIAQWDQNEDKEIGRLLANYKISTNF